MGALWIFILTHTKRRTACFLVFADSDAVHWLASFAKQHLSALPRRQKIVSLYARLGHGVLSACAGGFNMSASLDAELPISMAPRSS